MEGNLGAETDGELLVEDEVADVNEAAEQRNYRYTLTSYGADFLVDGLIQRLQEGAILIPTFDPDFESPNLPEGGFQREFVWTKLQMDRFIESLLLGLPVPGIFLVRDPDNMLLVLDGQQRLRTLRAFKEGMLPNGRPFTLGTEVVEPYRSRSFEDLEEPDKRQLLDSIIHATIVRQDEPVQDQGSIYEIFERLNTGGTRLRPQEIRVALYRGPLIELLRELNKDTRWRALFGRRNKYLKDQELILRFFALYFDTYRSPMVSFLNRYASSNRHLKRQGVDDLRGLFNSTTQAVLAACGPRAFRLHSSAVNAAVCDSVMVGVARRAAAGPISGSAALKERYDALLAHPEYQLAVSVSTSDEGNVRTRLDLATQAFADVP